jgi:predicted methyltransferase
MIRPKKEEIKVTWRKLQDEEFHNFYTSSNFNIVTYSRRKIYEEQVASTKDLTSAEQACYYHSYIFGLCYIIKRFTDYTLR